MSVKVKYRNYYELKSIMFERDLRSFSETISFLIDFYRKYSVDYRALSAESFMHFLGKIAAIVWLKRKGYDSIRTEYYVPEVGFIDVVALSPSKVAIEIVYRGDLEAAYYKLKKLKEHGFSKVIVVTRGRIRKEPIENIRLHDLLKETIEVISSLLPLRLKKNRQTSEYQEVFLDILNNANICKVKETKDGKAYIIECKDGRKAIVPEHYITNFATRFQDILIMCKPEKP